jgi:hypothetical protein
MAEIKQKIADLKAFIGIWMKSVQTSKPVLPSNLSFSS